MNILVLGQDGMLGHVTKQVMLSSGFNIFGTSRKMTENQVFKFDARFDSLNLLTDSLPNLDYVINCIGVIKPYIKDDDQKQVRNAIEVNSLFPHKLAEDAEKKKYRVIQIATDCVYSGSAGEYIETDYHDALDVYGKTKSLGEVSSSSFQNIRCSIIGREFGRSTSLWEWVKNQDKNATINGFTNHNWNGITTLSFARATLGIVKNESFSAGSYHLLPKNVVSKYELVSSIAKWSGREDITINPVAAERTIDRTLSTNNSGWSENTWNEAGYKNVPTVEEMVEEMANFKISRD